MKLRKNRQDSLPADYDVLNVVSQGTASMRARYFLYKWLGFELMLETFSI
jgi:hypothetical protein